MAAVLKSPSILKEKYRFIAVRNKWWNLRTSNNQEVAPGLYVYVVENKTPGFNNQKFTGKFAVVR